MDGVCVRVADSHVDGWSGRPLIIVGDSARALRRARQTVDRTGWRVACELGIEKAIERLEQQCAPAVLWIELERDGGEALDAVLEWVNDAVAEDRHSAVVSARAELVDPLFARLTSRAVAVVLDGDESERLAALALGTSALARSDCLNDVASESNVRLRQLSDEVNRIAATLARLSSEGQGLIGDALVTSASNDDAAPISLDVVRSVIRARRLRARYFDEALFADPAWDMLLDLTQAEITQLRVPVSSLCIAAAVPATTALRWIKTMTDNGLLLRRNDPHDGRRVFIEMAPETGRAMRRYFAEVGRMKTI